MNITGEMVYRIKSEDFNLKHSFEARRNDIKISHAGKELIASENILAEEELDWIMRLGPFLPANALRRSLKSIFPSREYEPVIIRIFLIFQNLNYIILYASNTLEFAVETN